MVDLSDMREELYLLSAEEQQYTVSLSLGLVTHWFTPHHHLHHQQLQLPSSSYPEKE